MRTKGYKCYNIKCGSCMGKTLCGAEGDSALSCVDRLVNTMTNADRFRSLSDEELAEQLVLNIDGLAPTRIYLSAVTGIGYISRKFAVDATKKALQQPYKEDA